MANLSETSTFDAGVYQLELTDPVIGGPSGVSNAPLKNLANRTKYLKDHVDALELSRAPLDSPALTGTPTAPTAAAGTNTTQLATTAFVNAEINSDRPFEATATNIKMDGTQSVGTLATVARGDHVHPTDTSRAPLASPGFTGTPTAPTATAGTNTTQIATTAFVKNAVDTSVSGFAPIASPTFTGNPAAPTPAHFDQDTSLATTEFVQRALGNYRTYAGLSGTNTLSASEAGGLFEITSGATYTTTLPAATSKAGLRFRFNNTSAYKQTIASNGGSFYGSGFSGVATYSIPPGSQCEFFSDGGSWKVIEAGFKCRAWVNFNGIGTVAVRAGGNVSSITDNGVGDYKVNFSTPMPVSAYCAQVSGEVSAGSNSSDSSAYIENAGVDFGYVRVRTGNCDSAAYYDFTTVHVSVHC